jgi:hypothetical protein
MQCPVIFGLNCRLDMRNPHFFEPQFSLDFVPMLKSGAYSFLLDIKM